MHHHIAFAIQVLHRPSGHQLSMLTQVLLPCQRNYTLAEATHHNLTAEGLKSVNLCGWFPAFPLPRGDHKIQHRASWQASTLSKWVRLLRLRPNLLLKQLTEKQTRQPLLVACRWMDREIIKSGWLLTAPNLGKSNWVPSSLCGRISYVKLP